MCIGAAHRGYEKCDCSLTSERRGSLITIHEPPSELVSDSWLKLARLFSSPSSTQSENSLLEAGKKKRLKQAATGREPGKP